MDTPHLDVITVRDIAARSGLTPRAVVLAVTDGDLPTPTRVIGRSYVWPHSALPAIDAALRRRALADPQRRQELRGSAAMAI